MIRLAAVVLSSLAVHPGCPGHCGARAGENTGRAVSPLLHRRVFRYWSRQPIADCSWVGESGPPGDYSGEFSARRYRTFNAGGSGARGKYQLMPSTWATFCRLCDWSRADQEETGHRLYRAQGTGPWAACG